MKFVNKCLNGVINACLVYGDRAATTECVMDEIFMEEEMLIIREIIEIHDDQDDIVDINQGILGTC